MNPSELLGRVIAIEPMTIPRPKSAIDYDRQQLILEHKRKLRKLEGEKQFKVRRKRAKR